MTNAPEKIWAFYTPDDFDDNATITAYETVQHGGQAYTRTDQHLALVAAALEKTASKMDVRHCKDMISKGRNPDDYTSPWSEVAKDIRAFISGDAQAALEKVKREAWQQGYETGTGEITGALDEAAAAKRMYREARNEALREAAAIAENYISTLASYGEFSAGEEAAAGTIEREILALMEDTDDE